MTDWTMIKESYISGTDSVKDLAERYGITEGTIRNRASKEGWKRPGWRRGKAEEERVLTLLEEKIGEKLARMEEVSGELLERISLAIAQLDRQVLREVKKEKEILYENPQRSDKATKEIITETETLTEVQTPIDRNGIKLLAAALKDVKEVQMLRDPTDLREQEAKIAKLQRDADRETTDSSFRVCFSTETEECST